jgi:tetratricopeptide (TPR) repeat protein
MNFRQKRISHLLKEATGLLESNLLDQAERIYTSVLDEVPDHTTALCQIGLIYEKRSHFNLAINYYQKAISVDPTFSAAYNYLGVIYKKQLNYKSAIDSFQKAITINPKQPQAYYNHGRLLAERGNLKEAINLLRKATDLAPKAIFCRYSLGVALHSDKQYSQAINEFVQLFDQEPDHIDSHFQLGLILLAQNKLQNARGAFEHILSLKADFLPALYELSKVSEQLGDLNKTLETYKKIIALQPGEAGVICNLAYLEKDNGMIEEAMKNYQEALKINPDLYEAHAGISVIYGGLKELDLARTHSLKAIKLKPLTITPCSGSREKANILSLRSLRSSFFQRHNRYQCFLEKENNFDDFFDPELYTTSELYLEKFLNDPDILDEIHNTSLIFNGVTDADASPQGLVTIKKIIEKLGLPVINDPENVKVTTRDMNYQRLKDIPNLVFPKTLRLNLEKLNQSNLAMALSEQNMTFPFILRDTKSHMGEAMVLIKNESDLKEFAEITDLTELFAIQYIDNKYQEKYYRRHRLIVIGKEILPVNCHFAHLWNVHQRERNDVMQHDQATQQEELRFLEDYKTYLGEPNVNALEEIVKATDLDYFGIDFDLMPDGSLLIFEVNASMAIANNLLENYEYMQSSIASIISAINRLIDTKTGALM